MFALVRYDSYEDCSSDPEIVAVSESYQRLAREAKSILVEYLTSEGLDPRAIVEDYGWINSFKGQCKSWAYDESYIVAVVEFVNYDF